MSSDRSNQLSVEQRQMMHGSDYAENFELHQDPNRLGRLLKYIEIPEGAEICDLGCGNALLLEFLAKPELRSRVKSYVGMDFSRELLAFAEKRRRRLNFENASFTCGDINELSKGYIGKFDVAFAMDFSEHVYDADWVKILKSARSMLKPGGKFYLHTPNRAFILELLKEKNFILKQFPEHIAVRDSAQNESLLKQAGFSRIKSHFLPHYNFLRFLHVFSRVWLVGKHMRARLLIEAS